MTRRRFSEREVIETLLRQGAIIPCPGKGCIKLLELEDLDHIERDHYTPLALGGEDLPSNCSYLHGECHARKTDGPRHLKVAGDKSRIAKAKRLASGPRKRRFKRLKGRPFGNWSGSAAVNIRRKMDGTIIHQVEEIDDETGNDVTDTGAGDDGV